MCVFAKNGKSFKDYTNEIHDWNVKTEVFFYIYIYLTTRIKFVCWEKKYYVGWHLRGGKTEGSLFTLEKVYMG